MKQINEEAEARQEATPKRKLSTKLEQMVSPSRSVPKPYLPQQWALPRNARPPDEKNIFQLLLIEGRESCILKMNTRQLNNIQYI